MFVLNESFPNRALREAGSLKKEENPYGEEIMLCWQRTASGREEKRVAQN